MGPLICESFSIVYTEVLHGSGWLDPRLQRNLGYGGTLDTEGQLKVICINRGIIQGSVRVALTLIII